MQRTVAEIAKELGRPFEGNGSLTITEVSGLREALPGQLAVLSLPKYAGHAASTQATAVVVMEDFSGNCPAALIRSPEPMADFTKIAHLFAPPKVSYPPGIHETAVVDPSATLGKDIHLGPHVVIEEQAVLGDGCVVMANTVVGPHVTMGRDCTLFPQVSVREHCQLGDRVIVNNGSVVGSEGFGYDVDEKGVRSKIPQIGIVVVEDDVEIGSNACIDRARFGVTRIGKGTKIDNLVQIAHNCILGEHCVIISQCGIAGSSVIGTRSILAGQSGIAGHLMIGEGALIGAQAGVTKDVAPGAYMIDFPALPYKKAAAKHAYMGQLPKWKQKLDSLEERLQQLENRAQKS